MNKLAKSIVLSFSCLAGSLSAQTFTGVNLFDDTFSLINGTTPVTTGTYEVRWGSYSGSVFTPYFGVPAGVANDGYVGNPFGAFELFASLTTADNTVISANTQLYLAVTLLADQANYVSSANEIILTDPSWLAPSFALVGDPKDVSLTASTTALKGSYSFNGGNQILTIGSATVIPEPSSFAALAGLAAVGMAASRRRRSA